MELDKDVFSPTNGEAYAPVEDSVVSEQLPATAGANAVRGTVLEDLDSLSAQFRFDPMD